MLDACCCNAAKAAKSNVIRSTTTEVSSSASNCETFFCKSDPSNSSCTTCFGQQDRCGFWQNRLRPMAFIPRISGAPCCSSFGKDHPKEVNSYRFASFIRLRS